MSSPQEVKPIRFSRRQATLRQAAINAEPIVHMPGISDWREVEAIFDRNSLTLEGNRRDKSVLIESPTFALPRDSIVYFSLFVEMNDPCGLHLSLQSPIEKVAERAVFGSGEIALSFRYVSKSGGEFRLSLAGYQPGTAVRVKTHILRLTVRAVKNSSTPRKTGADITYLPHWAIWQRFVHRLCARSRWVNAAVATLEMHLDREEMLSLPQYMAICPTGQCNASCGFCSVTTNRTGIIKKQLPFETLDHFLSPVVGTLRLFGLEGNGEPTLYDHFDELLIKVTSQGAPVYLISNGQRLTADQIALLLASPTDAINFSLNAATAETHQRVMKLKGWDAVVQNISRFVRWRGDARRPILSVSIVVTRDNAHEVQQFLHFAEWQLKVDRVLIRPLSEIANDAGAVEDLRDLVPYESQINDMFDAVAEYLEFVPRRAEIVVDPTVFNAFRPNPRNLIFSPPGFEDQLLAPRSTDWRVESDQIHARWRLNRLEISASSPGSPLPIKQLAIPLSNQQTVARWLVIARSRLVSVIAGRWMTFRCSALVRKGTLRIAIVDESGNLLGAADSDSDKNSARGLMTIKFLTPSTGGVAIELHSDEPIVESTIDFGRMYAWPFADSMEIKLPHSSRWQIDRPGTSVHWQGNELELSAQAQPGIYLYRSYTVAASPEESISLTVKIEVDRGALGIGILSEDGNQWLITKRYKVGSCTSEIAFNTVKYSGFQVVLYALTEELLRARINWGNSIDAPPVHKSRLIEPRQLLLPKSASWNVDSPEAEILWHGSVVQINWRGVEGVSFLRSPRFPCPRLYNERPTVSVHVSVKSGRLGLGFIGRKTENFTAVFYFPIGEHDRILEIDPDGHQSLMVVLFSDSSLPLEASVDWGKCLNLELQEAKQEWRGGLFDPRDEQRRPTFQAEPEQLFLPAQSSWIVDSAGVSARWIGSSIKIAWNGPKGTYLLRSPRFPCLDNHGEIPIVSVRVTVESGQLGIGFLGGQTEQFTNIVSLPVGKHNRRLEIDTDGQHHLMAVLFSDSSEPLKATVDWGDNFNPETRTVLHDMVHKPGDRKQTSAMEAEPGKLSKPPGILARFANIYMHAGFAGVIRKAAGVLARRVRSRSLSSLLGSSFRRLGEVAFNRLLKRYFPSKTIYCQKPWTDLNNFTVDGRMDVCCITTGPSQERYALGNIHKQDFQEIWNGDKMKEFRRTVNGKDKLPPCARCPMANNYRPPF